MSNCLCQGASNLIFACSGAADVGAVADRAARQLTAEGVGKMFCLAGIGGRVSGIMKTTAAADQLLAIDGCPMDCARKTLEEAGFSGFAHLQLGAIGMAKGQTPATDTAIAQAAEAGRGMLGA